MHIHRYFSQAIVRIRRGGFSDRWENIRARRESRRATWSDVIRHLGTRTLVGCYLDHGLQASWTGGLSVQALHDALLSTSLVITSTVDHYFGFDVSIDYLCKEHFEEVKFLRQYRNLYTRLNDKVLKQVLLPCRNLDSLAISIARATTSSEILEVLSSLRPNLRFLAIGNWDILQGAKFLVSMLESPFACLVSLRVTTDWASLSKAISEYRDAARRIGSRQLPESFARSSLQSLHIYMFSNNRSATTREVDQWLLRSLPPHVQLFIYDGGNTTRNQHRDERDSYCWPGSKTREVGWRMIR